MSTSVDNYQKKRLRSSYLYVILSMALVLFVVGLMGIVLIQAKYLGNRYKEQVSINVFWEDQTPKDSISIFEKKIKNTPFVKSTHFISKDSAAKKHMKDLGEDFVSYIGTNPLKDNLEIQLHAAYVVPDSVAKFKKLIADEPNLYEIDYNDVLIEKLDTNIDKLTFWVLIFSSVLTLIAFFIINSTIRLSLYERRFTIKTMQMVGATKSFIRRPFLITGIKIGVLGAVLAIIALASLGFYFDTNYPELSIKQQLPLFLFVFAILIIIGIILSLLSTYFATRRYLNVRTEALYE